MNGQGKKAWQHQDDVSEQGLEVSSRQGVDEAEGHPHRKASQGASDASQPGAAALSNEIIDPLKRNPRYHEHELEVQRAGERRKQAINKIDKWFTKRIDKALKCYDDLMDQDDDLRVKFTVAKDVLARNGAISPLDKIPDTAILNQMNVSLDPRVSGPIMTALESMKDGAAALKDSLRPIDQITESRYVSFSQQTISEPDRPEIEIEMPKRS